MKRKLTGMVILILSSLATVVCPLVRAQDLNPDLDRAIEKVTSALAPNSLRLPEPTPVMVPSAAIQAAGQEFVDVWRTWSRIMSSPPAASPAPSERKDLINANAEWGKFRDLLDRAMNAEPPPDPAEFDRFTYSSLDWCADGAMSFRGYHQRGLALTLLRRGMYLESLHLLSRSKPEVRDPLLRAFGVDAEEFVIGTWLHKGFLSDVLCKRGGERTARMLMDWVELGWDTEVERRERAKITHQYGAYDEPYFPRAEEIILLLSPNNGVTNLTKERIVKFIETRGRKGIPTAFWIGRCPRGAEKWLVNLAKQGLTDELNEIRRKSSRILAAAGVAHAKPEMLPAPRFSITINGLPWPGLFRLLSRPRLDIKTEQVETSEELMLTEWGIFTADPDKFRGFGKLRTVGMNIRQNTGNRSGDMTDYLDMHADVTLPVSFTEVNQIMIETNEVTIRPIWPEGYKPPEGEVCEVKFVRATGGRDDPYPPGREGGMRLDKGKPLVLPHISPGDYWIRVYHPGAVLSPPTRVAVSNKLRLIEPKLEPGASLVIPVEWPELKTPEKMPREIAVNFVGADPDLQDSLHSVLILKRKDGGVIEEFGRVRNSDGSQSYNYIPAPASAHGRFPNSAIFPYLPPGEYVVESPERAIEPSGVNPGCVIRKSSVSVVIGKSSPAFVVSEPLKIFYSSKE